MNIFFYTLFIKFFLILSITFTHSNEINDHRISVLVNDNIITSYDIIQRSKMNAIIKGIMITPENRDIIINSTVEELISEKLKYEKFNEYKISPTIDEIKNFEESFYLEKNYTKGELFEALAENNIKYKYLENYFKTEVSWENLLRVCIFGLHQQMKLK